MFKALFEQARQHLTVHCSFVSPWKLEDLKQVASQFLLQLAKIILTLFFSEEALSFIIKSIAF